MIETEFRILDTLSREIGNPISINKLTEKIKKIHGTAYYTNIHAELQNIEKKNIITLEKHGKSSVASFNFTNPLLIDYLAQIELIKKINFLETRIDWQTLVLQINEHLRNFNTIKSIIMIKPKKYAKLNRIELLILLHETESDYTQKLEKIQDIVELLEQTHNVRIDYLLLDEDNFQNLLRIDDANLIKEILADKIILYHTQTFWFLIKKILDEGIKIKVEENQINPGKISEQDLVYNLNRFGYKEFGNKISLGKNIGIEYITTSLLLIGDARKKDSIPIILAKHSQKTNYDLLVFLSKKYSTLEELLPYLKILYEYKPSDKLRECIHMLKHASISEKKIDTKDIRKKMRLYNVK